MYRWRVVWCVYSGIVEHLVRTLNYRVCSKIGNGMMFLADSSSSALLVELRREEKLERCNTRVYQTLTRRPF